MPDTYARYPALSTALPPLVRKQRRLATRLAPLEVLAEQDKAVRKDIDTLLVRVGFAVGTGVVCLGYDVTHRGRKGQTSVDHALLLAEFLALGISAAAAELAIAAATVTGEPSVWAEVKPCKGAKVRR
jgi:hypothetical protein